LLRSIPVFRGAVGRQFSIPPTPSFLPAPDALIFASMFFYFPTSTISSFCPCRASPLFSPHRPQRLSFFFLGFSRPTPLTCPLIHERMISISTVHPLPFFFLLASHAKTTVEHFFFLCFLSPPLLPIVADQTKELIPPFSSEDSFAPKQLFTSPPPPFVPLFKKEREGLADVRGRVFSARLFPPPPPHPPPPPPPPPVVT